MTQTKIGLLSPHSNFSMVAGNLADKLGINLVIDEYRYDDITETIKKWENGSAVEALVTGETIAPRLQGKTVLPLVTVQTSGYEMMAALSKAKQVGQRVILAEYDYLSSRVDISGLASLLDLQVEFLLFRDKAQLVESLYRKRDSVDAVVGTAVTAVEIAGEVGLPAFMVQCDRSFIKDALEKAAQISKIRRGNARLCRSIKAILKNAYDGILVVDENGKVALFNPVAEKITGLSVDKVLGEPVNQVKEINQVCRVLLGDGSATTREMMQTECLSFMVNRVPVTPENNIGLVITFQAADRIKQNDLKARKDLNRQGFVAQYRFSDIVGRSAMIEETVREARKYTRSDAALLITGESGTGKELFAQSIHNESSRRNGPFVAINCAALPESLLESELFGYEEGAFTGARKGGKQGLFAIAHGGTIFLDEIGDLSPSLQARLLRVLQQKEVMPVGGQRVLPVNVRVISATNRNLQEAVERGDFRVDLFYRLNVLHLHIPPLRMRMEDLPLLFKHIFQHLAGADRLRELYLEDHLLEELKGYLWPGNIRELEGFVERYIALGEEDTVNHVTFRSLLKKMKQNNQVEKSLHNNQVLLVKLGEMEDMEHQIIEQAMEMVGGSKGELAKMLGLSRTTLWKKLKKTGKAG